MKLVKQLDPKGCGVACVAMVAGISYEEAKRVLFPNHQRHKRSFASDTPDLRRALRSLGFQVADRCIRISKTSQLNQTALLKVNRQPEGPFHWTVWDHQNQSILDPANPSCEEIVISSALLIGEPSTKEDNE